MLYVSAPDLRNATSDLELAQVATARERDPIPAETMRKAIDGESLTGDPNEAAAIAALVKINTALRDAGDFIDTCLRGRYVLPLITPPTAIREIVIRVARYMLHNERAPNEVRERYKEAIGWCASIRDGSMILDVEAAAMSGGEWPSLVNDPLFSLPQTRAYSSWP